MSSYTRDLYVVDVPIRLHVDAEVALRCRRVMTNITAIWLVAARITLSSSQPRVRSSAARTVRASRRRGCRRRWSTELRVGPVDGRRVVVDRGGGVLLAHVDLERLAVLVVPVAAWTLEQLGGPAAQT